MGVKNLYTIVTNDEYEIPVSLDITVKEAAKFLGITENSVRKRLLKPQKKVKYRVFVSGHKKVDRQFTRKRYEMARDRSEYFREYHRKQREKRHEQL